MPKLLSVNAAHARTVQFGGESLTTGIFKEPVPGRVHIGPEGLAGDTVADRRLHGGPRKTVYLYPAEHYEPWARELGLARLPWGSFGENLTTEGLHEDALFPGDVLVVGSARLTVIQPRTPCVKLNARFGRADMIDRFVAARRSGVYLGVAAPGGVAPGDAVVVEPGPRDQPSILAEFDRRTRAKRATPG
jgi:MOSC domain-containing protein YiiM